MPQIINTNIPSLNAQRNLNTSQSQLAVSLQRLSSGLRINSAKDDAAGLAIAERFTTQIRGLNQAARNSNDGISLSQTAEGALAEQTNNLQRIRELAVQSANATNSSSDRAALQNEVSQLLAEIDRVAQQTKFNGVALLDGTFSNQQFQVGADSGQTISIASIASVRTSVLGGTSSSSYSTTTLAGGGAPTAALGAGDLIINGRDIGTVAQDARLIANAINAQTGLTSVTATASASSSGSLGAFSGLTGTAGGSAAYTLSVGGVNIVNNQAITSSTTSGALGSYTAIAGENVTIGATFAGNYSLTVDGTNVVNQAVTSSTTTGTDLNAFTTVTGTTAGSATFTLTVGSVTLVNAVDPQATTIDDAYLDNAITVTHAAALAAAGITVNGSVVGGDLEFTTDDGRSLTVTQAFGGDAAAGFTTIGATPTTYTQTYSPADVAAAIDTALGGGVGTTLSGLGISFTGTAALGTLTFTKADGTSLSVVEALTGGATGGFTTTVAGSTQTSNPTYSPNVTGAYIDSAVTTNAAALTTAGISYTGTAAAGTLTFSKADGSNLVLTETLAGNAAGGFAGLTGTQTSRGTLTLSGNGVDGITITGANTAFAGSSIIAGNSQATTTTVNFTAALGTVDISSVTGANAALSIVDAALSSVNTSRAELGAYQNRFASVIASLQTTSENLTSSRSRILDADFAAETAALTRGQILQQAGVAILAQANSLPQQVLSLLR
ncbi:MAG: flagellin [Gammaproteobacteria bacterium]|nr:flagellin [Gammaproteobacteria bacterium]